MQFKTLIGKRLHKPRLTMSLKKKKKKPYASTNKKRLSMGGDKKRRRRDLDEVIESSDEEDRQKYAEVENYGEEIEETPAEKRKRLLDESLNKLRARHKRDEEEEEEDDEYFDEAKRDKEGERDSRIANILQQEQLEESGRLRRAIASRVQVSGTSGGFRLLVKHRQTVTGVALTEDASRGFSASKDGTILHWDIEKGNSEKYSWPNEDILKSHGVKEPQGRATKHSKHVLALAVSSDGRYLASGGLDRHVHLWDVRTREHVQAFPGHKGLVSCLTFRQGTPELLSGSFDRYIKIWNVEDRTYVDTLVNHAGEVLALDSLRKELALSVGRACRHECSELVRDHRMFLWKHLDDEPKGFRAPKFSLECCCFISNHEFLSGSDDGSIQHWEITQRRIVDRKEHASSSKHKLEENNYCNGLSNGHIAAESNGGQDPETHNSGARSWISSIAVCRNSDLAASGAGNGFVKLWTIKNEPKGIHPLFELALDGFVNSLAFAKSAKFLIAGIGQEPRLGRWERVRTAQNGVAIHPLELS